MIFHSVLFQQLWRVNICLACTGLHVVKKPATVSSQSQTAFPNPCTKRRCQCFKQRSRCGFFRPVIEPRYLETFTSLLINILGELLRLQLIRYVQETPLAASKLANYWSGLHTRCLMMRRSMWRRAMKAFIIRCESQVHSSCTDTNINDLSWSAAYLFKRHWSFF